MKVFCRIFQAIMKVGMYCVPWKMPQTLEGLGSIKRLPALIKEKGFHKVLIVTDLSLIHI